MTHPPFRATSINDHKTQGVALSMVLIALSGRIGLIYDTPSFQGDLLIGP